MVNIIETPLDVSIHYPFFALIRAADAIEKIYGIVGASARSKAVACPFKEGFPAWFQGILDDCLEASIDYARYSERSFLTVWLRNFNTLRW